MDKFLELLPTIAMWVGWLTILSTIIVRITPSKKDDVTLENINSTVWRVINMLPTIGVNPRTKDIEKAYKQIVTNV